MIEEFDNAKCRQIFKNIIGPETFGLVVKGKCMEAGNICDGDVVLLKRREPKHGDVVAAAVGAGSFMLKRYHVENGNRVLRADSPGYPEFPVTDDVIFGGVVIGLIRVADLGIKLNALPVPV